MNARYLARVARRAGRGGAGEEGAVGEERIIQIRRRLINFTTARWDSLAHHREDAEGFHGHAAGDILWLLDEVDRLRAVEAAARVVVADENQMRSVHDHWVALYEALGVPRGTEAARWAAGQAGR